MKNSRKSICSREPEDSALPEDGRDLKRSPSAKANPTARKPSASDSGGMLPTPDTSDRRGPGSKQKGLRNIMMDLSQSSPTSETSTGQSSGGQLSLPGASPASLSLSPGSEEARRMTVTSGRKCSESYRKPGPLGSLVRMCLESSTWHSNKCVLTWKPKVMKSGRLLFQLQPSTPRTRGKGSGLLPTATQTDYKGADPARAENRSGKRHAGDDLPTQIGMLRTPDANMERGRRTKENMIERYQMKGQPLCLNDQLRMVELGMLPTPSLKEMSGGIRTKWARPGGKFCGLRETLAMLPTPKTPTGGGMRKPRTPGGGDRKLEDKLVKIGTSPGLKLQPAFVEWMMGYPPGFTDIGSKDSKPSATPSSPRSHTRSSRGSQK